MGWGQSLNAEEEVAASDGIAASKKDGVGPGMGSGEQVLPFRDPCEWAGLESNTEKPLVLSELPWCLQSCLCVSQC